MCLSIPARIISIDGDMAEVSAGGAQFRACIGLIVDPKEGEYILLHAGFAIQRISAKEASETLELLKEIRDASDE